MDFMLILWYNVIVHGADLVSTGSVEYGWQVECPRHGHKKINAKKEDEVFVSDEAELLAA